MSWEVLQGDCIKRMAEMEEASVDAVVCDPPAGIAFMGKAWDHNRGGRDRWVEWLAQALSAALRVCKPGAHAFVWALPRTSHWTAFALEDAGWEIRDRIAHHFGSGFPKNKNLGEGAGTALKPATEDWWLARKPFDGSTTACFLEHGTGGINVDGCRIETDEIGEQRSDRLRDGGPDWRMPGGSSGDGASSPAGRWPANVVLSHLEECEPVGTRVVKGSSHDQTPTESGNAAFGGGRNDGKGYGGPDGTETVEAWNCVPGCPVAALDAQAGRSVSRVGTPLSGQNGDGWGMTATGSEYDDQGGPSRFFYVAKTSRAERNAGLEGFEAVDDKQERYRLVKANPSRKDGGANKTQASANSHPTVKPLGLMRWLVRLVTPPGGTCLDPFLGSGSTGAAAVLEGFDFIGIEKESDYIAIAKARIAFWSKHKGREIEDVLGLAALSGREAKAHMERGQLNLSALADA